MKNSLGNRVKIQIGLETEEERKKRIAREKKERKAYNKKNAQLLSKKTKPKIIYSTPEDWLKKEIWDEGRKYYKEKGRDFIVDDENKVFLRLIVKYLTKSKEFKEICNGELRKGLLIYGTCGTGKSSIFDIIQRVIIKHNLMPLYFKNTSVHTVVNEFNKESKSNEKYGGEVVVDKYCRGMIHFDDLGKETIVQNWGIKEDLFDRILQVRYNKFKDTGLKTFVTTNLTIKELEERYSPQVKSRLYEMFNMLPLTGKDRRK